MPDLLLRSPYIAGPPLWEKEGFFGRQDILQTVVRELRTAATAKQIVLYGQRRIGKSSLLHQIELALPEQDFLTVYFDLQDQTRKSLPEVLEALTRAVAHQARLPRPPVLTSPEEEAFYREFLPWLYEQIGERRVVLLFDEFDALDDVANGTLTEKMAATTFFPFLRQLLAQENRLNFIFVVGRQIDDVRNYEATFKGALPQEVWVLSKADTHALILQGERNGTLKFSEEALEAIYALTSGHPYFTQVICERLWQAAHSTPINEATLITPETVNQVIPSALEASSAGTPWLWEGLTVAERIYISALAEWAQPGAALSNTEIENVLVTNKKWVRHQDISVALEFLLNRRILCATEDRPQAFRFGILFFHHWVKRFRPLNLAKDELDQIDPTAQKFYESGLDFYENAQWTNAEQEFRKALEFNAQHFKARLHLGLTLTKQHKIDEAILELEKASQLDNESDSFLVDALLDRAKISLAGRQEELALSDYRWVLSLAPHNPSAEKASLEIEARIRAKPQKPVPEAQILAAKLVDSLKPYLTILAQAFNDENPSTPTEDGHEPA